MFPSTKIFRQRIKVLETKLTTEQKETEKLRTDIQQERYKTEREVTKLEQKFEDLKSQERKKHLAEINDLQEKVKELEHSLGINIPTSEKATQTNFDWDEELRQKDLKIEELRQQQLAGQKRLSINIISQPKNPNLKDSSWAELSTEDKPLSPSQIREREKQKKRQSQEQSAQIQINLSPKTPPKN